MAESWPTILNCLWIILIVGLISRAAESRHRHHHRQKVAPPAHAEEVLPEAKNYSQSGFSGSESDNSKSHEKNLRIFAITDLDKKALQEDSQGQDFWVAYLKEGTLHLQQNEDPAKSTASIEWHDDKTRTIKSSYSYQSRGMELSTLSAFNGKLYSCDDKTGIVFELPILEESLVVDPIPWVILADGNGGSNGGGKGFKCEWATIKDGDLWIGGHGTSKGDKYVKIVTSAGQVTHVDWTANFDKMDEELGIHAPGYVTHEAGEWSDVLQKWIFLPRKVSREEYEVEADESRGSNIVITADADFNDIELSRLGNLIPTHGVSAFKFLPGTHDTIIVAIKEVEIGDDVASSYALVSDLKNHVLMPETEFAKMKFEGVEFFKRKR